MYNTGKQNKSDYKHAFSSSPAVMMVYTEQKSDSQYIYLKVALLVPNVIKSPSLSTVSLFLTNRATLLPDSLLTNVPYLDLSMILAHDDNLSGPTPAVSNEIILSTTMSA